MVLLFFEDWWGPLSSTEKVFWGISLVFSVLFLIQFVVSLIGLDFDTDVNLKEYAEIASSFLLTKTGYDWGCDTSIEPLAKQCAKMYIRDMFFNRSGGNYNTNHDYSLGITSLLIDLQMIAAEKVVA